MEFIINNPGLQHLVEKVFWNLDVEDLKICAHINQSCKQILQNPLFCLRKFENLSMENRNEWIQAIQSVKNYDKGIAIISYLKWNLKKEVVDPPCYPNNALQILKYCCAKRESSDEDIEIAKLLENLRYNLKGGFHLGMAIHSAVYNYYGHTEIVKILVLGQS